MPGLNYDIYDEMTPALIRLAEKAKPEQRKRFLRRAGAIVLSMERRIWKTNGGELGVRWKPLSKATIAMRKSRRKLGGKRAGGMKPLRDTGLLRNSVASGSMLSAPRGAIRSANPDELIMGSNLSYAATQQYGRGPITIPGVRVRAHTRRGRKRGEPIQVRTHTRTQRWGRIPPRPFLGWTQKGSQDVLTDAANYFFERPVKGKT